ncbi:hypothetical protein QCA50_016315 [Cerrena zonata]|uniref:Protein kinase domain-containing protein n=1 Tax=Cerrena zonata TaxID=2478898 RepID=A0AAW0FLX4_9APHY
MHRHCTAPASTGSLPQDSHILRLIRVSLKYPDRCVALVTLRGGDAQRAMDLIYKLLRYPEYWREEIPDISIGYRDFTLPRLFFELGKQASKQPADFICQGVQREPVRDFDYAPGGFADVFRGKLIEKDGKLKKGDIVKKYVALKKPRHTLSMTKDERALQAESTKHECLMWSPLSHPNIVKFLGVTESNKTLNDVPCMISPWRHELLKQIKTMRHQGTYPTTYELDHWLLDIAAGLAYLHSRHIVHANLQTSNILVSTEEDCVAQIADFALSFFADSDIMLLPDFKAIDKTPSPWHAPELHIATISELPTRRTFATDTFAFGCVCIELYTSHHPFYGQRDDQAAANVLRGVIPLQPSTPRGEKMDDALWQIIALAWLTILRIAQRWPKFIEGYRLCYPRVRTNILNSFNPPRIFHWIPIN